MTDCSFVICVLYVKLSHSTLMINVCSSLQEIEYQKWKRRRGPVDYNAVKYLDFKNSSESDSSSVTGPTTRKKWSDIISKDHQKENKDDDKVFQ